MQNSQPLSSRAKSIALASNRSSTQRSTQRKFSYTLDALPRKTIEVDYMSKYFLASAPWIAGQGIDISDSSIVQSKDFFAYSSKSFSNCFSAAAIAVKACHRSHICECEFRDGMKIECEQLSCELEILSVSGGILVGVASEDTLLGGNWLEDERCIDRVWYYASPLGQFRNGPRKIPKQKVQCGDVPTIIHAGDRVVIRIDLTSKCVDLLVNNNLCGRLKYKCEVVRPAVFLFAKGSSVRVSSLVLRIYDTQGGEATLDSSEETHGTVQGIWKRCHELISTKNSDNMIFGAKSMATAAYSCAVRTEGCNGPCGAMLSFCASTKWIAHACTGKRLTVEFEIRERFGSMDLGVVSCAVPISSTWCDIAWVGDAYWYSWSGALRRGCELCIQTGRILHKGDAVRVEVDLYLGRVAFFINDDALGSLVVEPVEAIRRLEDAVSAKRKELLAEIATIASLKEQVKRGRFALVPEVNRRVAALTLDQAGLVASAASLKELTASCDIQLYPAIALYRAGDQVLVDGSLALMVQEHAPPDDTLAQIPDLEKPIEPQESLSEADYDALVHTVRHALGRTGSPLLELLTATELDVLVDGHLLLLEDGAELKASNGDDPATLYVLLDGRLSVRIEGAAGSREVAVLGDPGRAFGELAATQGKRFKAQLYSIGVTSVFEVTRERLQAVLTERGEALTRFQTQTQRRVNANAVIGEAWRSMFLLHEQAHIHA